MNNEILGGALKSTRICHVFDICHLHPFTVYNSSIVMIQKMSMDFELGFVQLQALISSCCPTKVVQLGRVMEVLQI